MAYSGRGLFALQKGQVQVGSHVSEAEKEQVVAFEKRAMPRSRIVLAVCLLCHLAWPSSVCPHPLISSLMGQFCRPTKRSEKTHSEGVELLLI